MSLSRRCLRTLSAFAIIFAASAIAQAQPVISSVVNGASFQSSLSPGVLASVFGINLTSPSSVTLAGIPCAVLFSSSNQINLELPVNAATGSSNLVVVDSAGTSNAFPITLNTVSPGMSTSNGSGSGLGVFTDGSFVVSASLPVHPGDTIASYGVGLGATNPVVATGAVSPSNPLAVTVAQTTVTVGGVAATVTFSGLEPGQIAAYQVNFTVPLDVPLGNQSVTWTIDGVTSPAVTLPIAAGSPANLAVTGGTPQTSSINTQFTTPLSVLITDAENNPVPGVAVTFTVPTSGASATFANLVNTAVTNTSGIATLAAFANGVTGGYNVTASVTGVTAQGTFILTNQNPSSAPNQLITQIPPPGVGTVTPPSGQFFQTGAVVQITAIPATGYTFSLWSGPVADRYASTTTVTMNSNETVSAIFIAQVFTDVPPTAYYFDAVNLLSQDAITAGCGVGLYCPTEDVTRAQMAIFIVRGIEGTDNFTYSPTPYFTDVPSGSFGFQWIQKMYELGITSGCGGGLYCPNDSVTRAQMAIFMIRARYGVSTVFDYPATPYFTDVPANGFGFAWIQRMREDNITGGCGPNLYCPNNPVIRGDMAIFLMRGLFNRLLPPAQPVLLSVSPNIFATSFQQTVLITAANTNFVQGVTVVNAIAGFTVGAVTVTSPTTLSVVLTSGSTVTPQPESIWIVSGAEEAVLPNAITVGNSAMKIL